MTGYLRKNQFGRWQICDRLVDPEWAVNLYSGDLVEVLLVSDRHDETVWIRTRIDTNGPGSKTTTKGIILYVGMPAREVRS